MTPANLDAALMEEDAGARADSARDARFVDDLGNVDPLGYQGPLTADGVDLSAERQIVRHGCAGPRYGDGFVIAPVPTCSGAACGPGIVCTRPQDCRARPHALCITSSEGNCDYGQGPVAPTTCVADADCVAMAAGRCVGAILQTFCDYNNSCTTDADCKSGQRCDCGVFGNRSCFEVDCLKDVDCPSSQHCLRSNPCHRGPNGDYRCTTPEDECVPYADEACGCDYDLDKARWVCTPPIICD